MEFRMDRNGSGYYDGTAYKGVLGMAKAGEIWQYVNNSGYEQTYLIIKNNEKVCTALLLRDEDSVNSVEVAGMYTEPRMIQYIYTNNLTRRLDKVDDAVFQTVLDTIRDNLGLRLDVVEQIASELTEPEVAEDAKNEYDSVVDELVLVMGKSNARVYCAASAYKCRRFGQNDKAEWYLKKLEELGGIDGE